MNRYFQVPSQSLASTTLCAEKEVGGNSCPAGFVRCRRFSPRASTTLHTAGQRSSLSIVT